MRIWLVGVSLMFAVLRGAGKGIMRLTDRWTRRRASRTSSRGC
jgi:hypothetical protein